MWNVSAAFLQALTQSHQLGYSCTITPPGGTATALVLASGSVSVQTGQGIRRTAQLTISGGDDVFALLSIPGAVLRLSHGVVYSQSSSELVPLITGELSGGARDLGNGVISATVADFGQRLAACTFLTPQNPLASNGRLAVAAGLVTDAIPGTKVTNTATDQSTIGTSQTWSTSRTDMLQALLTDSGAEGFFLPDGSYLIRDIPAVSNPAVWTLRPGDGGSIKSQTRNRPLDKLYNTVVVQPSALDGSQNWVQIVAQISDTTNPRHPNYIGTRPLVWQSPTIMTATQAQAVASALLAQVLGSTETLQLGAISNPALEGGDVVRAVNPTPAGNEIIQHITDGFSIDVLAGDMTLATRAASE